MLMYRIVVTNARRTGAACKFSMALATLVALFVTGATAQAGLLSRGDILVSGSYAVLNKSGQYEEGDGGIFRVDPVTGERTVISDATHGTGPDFQPTSVAWSPDGTILATDTNARTLLRIDPATGNRTVLASAPDPETLSSFRWPLQVYVDPAGRILMSALDVFNRATLYQVDPTSGDHTVITGADVGTGPLPTGFVNRYAGIAVSDTGQIYLTTPFDADIYKVDPLTGNREILGGQAGSPISFNLNPLIFSPSGQLLVGDVFNILAVDPTTGFRTAYDHSNLFGFINGLAYLPNGDLVVSDARNIAIVELTGGTKQTLYSLSSIASDPKIFINDLAVVVPEPSALVMALLGLIPVVAALRLRAARR
jgi:sugar lactone lactonase YvrE